MILLKSWLENTTLRTLKRAHNSPTTKSQVPRREPRILWTDPHRLTHRESLIILSYSLHLFTHPWTWPCIPTVGPLRWLTPPFPGPCDVIHNFQELFRSIIYCLSLLEWKLHEDTTFILFPEGQRESSTTGAWSISAEWEWTRHADILTHTVPTNTRPRVHAAKHTCSDSQALTWEPRIFWDPRIHRQTFSTHTCIHTHIHTGIKHTQKTHAVPATYCRLENYPKLGGMKQRQLTMLLASVGVARDCSAVTRASAGKNQKAGDTFSPMSGPWPEMTPMAGVLGHLSPSWSPGLSMRPL